MFNVGRNYHGSKGSGPAAGLHLSQSLLLEVSSLSALLEVALDLAVLGQVQGGDLLGLLDLLLVALDLPLELVDQGLHPLVVLPVLRVQLGLQLTNSGLHLGHCLLPALQSVLL